MQSRLFMNFGKRAIRAASILVLCAFLLGSCSNRKSSGDLGDYSSYLGTYAYNVSITAMVYEDMDDEGKGIQYREVTDIEKLITQAPLYICLYFYSSLRTDNAAVTASIEELAEEYHDQILFVSIDGMQEKALLANFSIAALPDFVMLKDGVWIAAFGSSDKESWTNEELSDWVLTNSGIKQ